MMDVEEEEEEEELIFRPKAQQLTTPEIWYRFTEQEIVKFIQMSPLQNIAPNISPVLYRNLSPFLVNEVIRMSNPVDGVRMALQTVLETMQDTFKEAVNRLVAEESTETKPQQSITLLCETMPMPRVTLEELDEKPYLRDDLTLQYQHLLANDRHRGWLHQYRRANAKTINVFTIRMGPGITRATSDTGRYIVSVVMPFQPAPYQLKPVEASYSKDYEEINAAYQKVLVEAGTYRRFAEAESQRVNGNTKHTPHAEAKILAQQLQDKRYKELIKEAGDLIMMNAALEHQIVELREVLTSVNNNKLVSMSDTIMVLIDRLRESRARNLKLTNRLTEHGINPLANTITWTVSDSPPLMPVKLKESTVMTKRQNINKRNTKSSTSSGYEEEEEGEGEEENSSISSSYSSFSSESENDSIDIENDKDEDEQSQ